MKIIVTKDTVKIEEFDLVHEGEHKVNKCSFSFSAEYTKELVKKAIFTSQNSSVEVAIINNECDIPTEILRARNIVLLGVYAYKVTEDKLDLRYSPSPDAFKVNDGSYIEGASDSEEITSSQFEQYMQALNDGLNKVEESLKEIDEVSSSATQLVNDINQKLENGDFIGPEGPQGVPGKDGVGITTITSGQSTVEEDKTVTPVTVNKTDGSSESFNIEAKNGTDGNDGKDGVNGQDGLTPSIGANGNWFLGDTDTGKPSRGEIGPTPDLTDYVKNTDYANASKAGVLKINGNAARISSDGVLSAAEVSEEQYKTTVNSIFISKGTLENIKNDYVGSSTPVQDLTSTVTNIQEEQDESKPKNTASGEMITVDDAIAYKTFEVKVDGASEQQTTTGKNLFDYTTVRSASGLTTTINTDGSITTKGTPTIDYIKLVLEKDYNDKLVDGETYTISQDVAGYIYLQIYAVPKDGGSTIYYASSNSQTRKEFSFTVDKSIYDYKASLQSGLLADVGENINFTAKFQLEKGSKATSYEPYTGGQPSPNPDYPQEITTLTFDKITRCGKNLIPYPYTNTSKVYNGITFTDNGDGSITANGTATGDAYFDVMGNAINKYKLVGNYITGGNKDISINVTTKNEEGNYIVLGTSWNDSDSVAINKSVYDIGYIGLRIASGTTVNNVTVRPMMTMEPDTDYEPYQATEYAIDLQGNEMVELPNGVKDELMIDKYGNVSLIKNVGKVVYTNSNNFNKNGQNKKRIQYLTPIIENIPLNYGDRLDNIFQSNVISSIYVQDGTSFAGTTTTSKIRVSISREYLNIQEESNPGYLNALNELLQSLNESGNPFTIYYPLATPQIIPLGTLSNSITTLNGTNNISINGNIPTTISTTYALDIKKYIDNKLAEIASAMIEEG